MSKTFVRFIKEDKIQLPKSLVKIANQVCISYYHSTNKSQYLPKAGRHLEADEDFQQKFRDTLTYPFEYEKVTFLCDFRPKTKKQREEKELSGRNYNYEVYVDVESIEYELLKMVNDRKYICYDEKSEMPIVFELGKRDSFVTRSIELCNTSPFNAIEIFKSRQNTLA